METPPAMPAAEIQGQAPARAEKKKGRSGCGCIIVLLALGGMMLLLVPEPPEEVIQQPTPATRAYLEKVQRERAAAKHALPTEAVNPPLAGAKGVATQPKPKTQAIETAWKAKTAHPAFTIKSAGVVRDPELSIVVYLDVGLDSIPDETEIEALSRHIYASKNGGEFKSVLISYYLPGMNADDPYNGMCGAWATGRFGPALEIRMDGISSQSGRWISSGKNKKVTGAEAVVGKWADMDGDNEFASLVTVYRIGDKFFMRKEHPNGDSRDIPLSVSKEHEQDRYTYVEKSHGCYFSVAESGDLCYYSQDGARWSCNCFRALTD